AHAWRLTALASLAVTFVAVVGVVWIGAQNRVVPYVVQTDKLGDALAISRADIAAPADPRLIRADLARWISDVRTVYFDVAAERTVVNEAYTMVNRNAAAAQQLNDWFSHHDPFKRAQTEMVGVSVESVLPISGNTWRVEWREDKRGRDGMADAPTHWQATITISISPPTNDAKILVNPVGLYVDSFDWEQRQ
ncbi:MAG TPA: type IV secretion system protein, partial [Acetobacteraceae bacterium]|nr:type IV secretion system protein [Acetobacteraceae bacterium]